jgi:NAD(P)-dependent dehydrogenase (short-subunit alcohol dehydrogenase family)
VTNRLDGRTAVVTGGANGIGRACCVRFADEGANVVVADLLDASETVALVKERGREALSVQLDATSEASNEAMTQTATERFGRIDVLVTAAGILHANAVSGDVDRDRQMLMESVSRIGQPGAGIASVELADWQKILDVNLTGTLLACKAVAPVMIEQKSGSIIHIASIAAKHPEAGPLAYGVSKAGVWMLTKQLAGDLAGAGVRVNAIGPGFIETNMTTAVFENDMIRQMLLTRVPLQRLGRAEDIANAALFLASDESSYFTGEILHPDGGYYTE